MTIRTWRATALGVALVALAAGSARAQITAEQILQRVDDNMTIRTVHSRAIMSITYREGDVRDLEFESWAEGEERSFLEFTSPPRDAGSRFLRVDDKMWIYLPRAARSVRIQGRMLEQIEREEPLDGRPTYVLYLTGKRRGLAYPQRRIWVDAERWVPLKEERFARSGKLLKTAVLSDVRQIEGRWYPFQMDLDNALQADTRTSLRFLELEFDIDIPEQVFSLRTLERGS
jgi:outer membrane lipoprotein-sorting protein